jgi:peptidoglycan/LPS O-acetylase OafA/YrhL
LIVLGGHILPLLATLLFVAVLIIVASVSYRLIEQPGEEWARVARWANIRPKAARPQATRPEAAAAHPV